MLPEPLDGPGRSGELPSGTYRYVLTEDEINAAIEDADDDVAGANAGVWTWTLGNGRWANQVQLTARSCRKVSRRAVRGLLRRTR